MSPSIGDLLGDDQRENFYSEVITEGSIICYFDTNIKPEPKYKFIIIACKGEEKALVVYINSEININFNKTFREQKLHCKIKKEEYADFLEYDSFIDCCHPKEKELTKLAKEVSNNKNRNKGNISDSLLQTIIDNIERAHTVPTKLKKKYGLVERSNKGGFVF